MKKFLLIFATIMFMMCLTSSSFGQICTGSISHTTCFPYISGDGVLPNGEPNDTPRLNRAITATLGKLIFNESEYFLGNAVGLNHPAELTLFSYRIIEGTGKSVGVGLFHNSSKIIQTAANKSIFKIGPSVYDISIRDIVLIGGAFDAANKPDRTVGILAESNCLVNCTSLGFQFSNLKFSKLAKGIYVNANDPPTIPSNETSAHQWQFDNVRLDHALFDNCTMGVHINSYNSGWNISSLDFLIPAGAEQGDYIPVTYPLPTTGDPNIAGKTYGVYLERSTYTSMDLLIGNGPTSNGPPLATALIYVREHANLSIQSTVAEGFHDDVIVHGISRDSPINLMNNTFLNGVRVRLATVYSTGNQYSALNNTGSPAMASEYAQIYSIGDKYCTEGTACDEGRGFTTSGGARVIYSTNQGKNTTSVPTFMDNLLSVKRDSYSGTDLPILSVIAPNFSAPPLLRLGVRTFTYDFSRSESDGKLVVRGSQNGYSGYKFETCENCQGNPATDVVRSVSINNNGSVTLGSIGYSSLGGADNGTLIYCSDCQTTNPCAGGGNGAIAKRINGAWICN